MIKTETRINLNDWIKVKLTDRGKEIYYHSYDDINQSYGKIICKPDYPKVDKDGYTRFQLWQFIQLYGPHIGVAHEKVIDPIEIVWMGGNSFPNFCPNCGSYNGGTSDDR